MISKEYSVENMSNADGTLKVKTSEGKYLWTVSCCIHKEEWYEIPETLFLEIEKYCKENSDGVRLVEKGDDWW